MKKIQFNVYGCGGSGINITRKLAIPGADGYPNVKKVFFDTSDRNVSAADMDNTFLLAGMNGAGKDQRLAHGAAAPQLNDFLITHKPGVMNIIIFGAAGGSGAPLGSLLFAEMTKRDIPCIAVVIGNTTSEKETVNTKNTLRTLRNLSANVIKKPMSMMYFENGIADSSNVSENVGNRSLVDDMACEHIRKVALLTSESNDELDRTDIANWLQYTRVTDVDPQLTDICISDLERAIGMTGKVISTACLLNDTTVDTPALSQLYSAVGYIPQPIRETLKAPLNIVFSITPVLRDSRIDMLTSKEEDFAKVKAFSASYSAAPDDKAETEDGFMF